MVRSVRTLHDCALIENHQKLRWRDEVNLSVGFEVCKMMIPRNEVMGLAGHGAFQDAVIRGITDDGNGFRRIDDLGKVLEVIEDFPGHLHLPAELLRQHLFDFVDDEGGGGIVDAVFPGQLQNGFGIAPKVEGRNDDIGVNYHS